MRALIFCTRVSSLCLLHAFPYQMLVLMYAAIMVIFQHYMKANDQPTEDSKATVVEGISSPLYLRATVFVMTLVRSEFIYLTSNFIICRWYHIFGLLTCWDWIAVPRIVHRQLVLFAHNTTVARCG